MLLHFFPARIWRGSCYTAPAVSAPFTRLWRICKRRSPITCSSFIVCTVVVLEATAGWSGGVVFKGYTNRKERCLSILNMDASPSYTLAVNAELRQKSLVQCQATLSLFLGRLWTVAIMENARFVFSSWFLLCFQRRMRWCKTAWALSISATADRTVLLVLYSK